MREMLTPLLLSALLVLGLIACGGENAYDGERGLLKGADPTTLRGALSQIHSRVYAPDTQAVMTALEKLESEAKKLQNAPSDASGQAAAKEAGEAVLIGWKRIEAIFIAGAYERDLIDVPNYIDYFRRGNDDIPASIQSHIESDSDLSTALYQSSHKSVTALEYALFGSEHNSSRRWEAVEIMAGYIKGHLKAVAAFHADSAAFVDAQEESVEHLLNRLIDSSYKLQEWRIGDVGGLSVKYSGDPDAARLEFPHGDLAGEAILAIIKTHEAVIEEGLSVIATIGGASESMAEVEAALAELKSVLLGYGDTLKDDAADFEPFYEAARDLHDAYNQSLINALNLTANIVEADGD
jgi:predicted lipoprotein